MYTDTFIMLFNSLHSIMDQTIIQKTVEFVQKTLDNAEWWHDWRHIYRVRNTAKNIAAHEDADRLVVELGALLHDIAEPKFHNGDEELWCRIAREFLTSIGVTEDVIIHVENIIAHISFKNSFTQDSQTFYSKELAIVQDADRLDALWAIWIARTFNYWGYAWRELYNPAIKPNLSMTKEEYKKSTAPSINHFYEKLLLLKDKMNTDTGKRIAENRHRYMEQYLEQFFKECEWIL